MRWMIGIVLGFLANIIGLWLASIFVEGFDISGSAFLISAVIYSVCSAILGPFISKMALTKASFLMGGIGLVNTFVALLITSLISDGIAINGITAWFVGTVVVWF